MLATRFSRRFVNREIKHDVIRQTANASLPFKFFPSHRILKEIPQKIREKSHICDKTNFSFPRTNAKQQTAEVELLPFAGKVNVMLNLSYMFFSRI